MNASTTLYRFRLDVSDIDRGVYETLDFRLAKHPSENLQYLLTRVFAFALNTQEGLEFSPAGLSDPDAPTLFVKHPNGRMSLWIEIGNPSPRKLHKASKASAAVKVYTYKDPEQIFRESRNEEIHRAEEIEIFSFKSNFLDDLAKDLPKDVRWNLVFNEGVLTVSAGDKSLSGEVKKSEFPKEA